MKLGPRERAMLAEMGVAWPEVPRRDEAMSADRPTHELAQVPQPQVQQPQVAQPQVPQPTGLPWPEQPSWDELQAEVATCSRCGLCKARRNTVFGVGHLRAAVMVVGEAPGEQEDRQGEPFVGAAGQLLDRMLDAIGLSRTAVVDDTGSDQPSARGAAQEAHQVFITNTVKCRPPQNRNPEPTELAACEPVLHRQMELVRPRLVLAMGRFAAQQLLRTDEAIGRLRGRVHRITGAGATWAGESGVPVVVTYHPAYLLRNPIDKAKAWDDLCLALDTLTAQAEKA
jgi:DNA polymerase